MEHVISGDRTSIAYERTGDGSPLVLVHGTGIDHTYWTPVLGTLERALCSLEASLLTPYVRKLVLYEPPIYTTIDIPYPADALDRFNAFLDSGDAEGALEIVYEIGHAPAKEVALQRSLPNWAARIEATPTLPRELLGAREYKFVGSRFSGMKAPVLLLVGEETIPFYKEATKLLGDTLPNNRLSVLPGQGHEAVIMAPDTFIEAVVPFLLSRNQLRPVPGTKDEQTTR